MLKKTDIAWNIFLFIILFFDNFIHEYCIFPPTSSYAATLSQIYNFFNYYHFTHTRPTESYVHMFRTDHMELNNLLGDYPQRKLISPFH